MFFLDMLQLVSGRVEWFADSVQMFTDVVVQVWTAGQVIGLIHDIPTCEELVRRIEREAVETIRKSTSSFIPDAGEKPVESGSGSVGSNQNNPGAEIWGVGKSKL